ncbi:MAG: alkaline phosphatase family protein [bacterium]
MALIVALGIALSCSPKPQSRTTDFKVVVLGFDGVDPDLVEKWIDHLPNIQKLSESGTLSVLGTTNPPESPVAWASFSTGMNPGKHGIFDFLRRDPETYYPDIGLVKLEKARFLGGVIPIKAPKIIKNRKGVPFGSIWIARGYPLPTSGFHLSFLRKIWREDQPGRAWESPTFEEPGAHSSTLPLT